MSCCQWFQKKYSFWGSCPSLHCETLQELCLRLVKLFENLIQNKKETVFGNYDEIEKRKEEGEIHTIRTQIKYSDVRRNWLRVKNI